MQHYWGAKAILARIGLKANQHFPAVVLRYSLPVVKRPNPKHPSTLIYVASEAAIAKWELSQAQLLHERLKTELREKQERKERAKNYAFAR
jgi:hypothetical protein